MKFFLSGILLELIFAPLESAWSPCETQLPMGTVAVPVLESDRR